MNVSEDQTRRYQIDLDLERDGWRLGETALREFPTADGPADYLLQADAKPIAIVEAKRPTAGSPNVASQAERYARGLPEPKAYHAGEFGVPFVYATNGAKIWFRDVRESRNLVRAVARYHTPRALEEKLAFDELPALQRLRDLPFTDPRLRPYQRDAIVAIERAIEDRKRKMLVAMATGTGKTYTTVSQIYRLMAAGYARRVLFLVDRRALAAQAMQAFSAYQTPHNRRFADEYEVYGQRFQSGDIDEDDAFDPKVLPNEYLTNPSGREAFVYVSTIQGMRINLFGRPAGPWGPEDEEDGADLLDIPIHAFDLIVADECHRGYTASETGKWREVLDHFDAIQIGLTATPAAHTTAHFKEIVFRYPYERAVQEGYLVDFESHRVQSAFRQKGLFLKEGDEVVRIDATTGERTYDALEDEIELAPTQIEAEWTSRDSNLKIVRAYLELARKHEEETGHFPKTLVFADNDLPNVSHADLLVELLRAELGRHDWVAKITGSVDRPLRRIKELRNRPEPKIAVTVDLLSTGVDIRSLEFIVILRPIKSRILFEQILGRGTRTCQGGEFHPASLRDKTHFVVVDCMGALEYFKNASAFTDSPPDQPTRTISEIVDAIANNQNRAYNEKCLAKRLQRMAKSITAEGRERFAAFVQTQAPHLCRDIEPFAAKLSQNLIEHWTETVALLRNPDFQDLLENYPKPPKVFLIDEQHEDEVSVSPGGDRPDDYISAFERFVRDNPNHIAELDILLHLPSPDPAAPLFSLADLEALRAKLRAAPETFTEARLRRAYGRPLADIVSLVRHAATGQPILDQAQRVDRAVEAVKAALQTPNSQLSPAQERWLELIRVYLHENLLIDRRDLDLPTFATQGATPAALDRAFGGRLDAVLDAINRYTLQ